MADTNCRETSVPALGVYLLMRFAFLALLALQIKLTRN